MKKIIWIGSPFFSNHLAEQGWEDVYVHTFSDFRLFTYEELVDAAGFSPDLVVVADKSMPPFVVGIENFPCLTALYVVDSHLHSWYPLYAQAFDLCLVSLYDHLSFFLQGRLSRDAVYWSPPYAQDAFRPKGAVDPVWDCIFVGTVNENTPLRKIFLAELAEIFPSLHVTSGNFVSLFPQAKVVLNFCEYGDLNFRVFESLGLGSALVTPRIGNRQSTLFTNGKHCLFFENTDVQDAKRCIMELLDDEKKRQSLKEAGLACIDAHHRASHRARGFTDWVRSFWAQRPTCVAERLEKASGIRERYVKLLYLLWAKEIALPKIQELYLAFAKGERRL